MIPLDNSEDREWLGSVSGSLTYCGKSIDTWPHSKLYMIVIAILSLFSVSSSQNGESFSSTTMIQNPQTMKERINLTT